MIEIKATATCDGVSDWGGTACPEEASCEIILRLNLETDTINGEHITHTDWYVYAAPENWVCNVAHSRCPGCVKVYYARLQRDREAG